MQNVKEISLSDLQVSKVNPRTYFDEEKLKELAESIKVKGVISPILVRPLKLKDSDNKDKPVLAVLAKDVVNGKFEIVYGERRFKASLLAKLKAIPAIVRVLTDAEVLELQVIENLQREDLNPIEEAQGFKALLEQCKYTQEKLAGKIGKSQGYIAARLALLNLTDDFQKDIASAKLLPGHVKHLMVIADRPKILTAIRKEMGSHKEQLTVRAFESIVGTVLGRQAKQLTNSSYGGGPEFNTKDCNDCEFKRTTQSSYGSPEKKCVNSDCYNKKQRLARKAQTERVKEKISKGGVVDESQLNNVVRLNDYRCKFDVKTCKRCEKRKIAKSKDFHGKVKSEEVCIDKECFNRKNQAWEDAKEKQELQSFKKKVDKVKAKAVRTKMDRIFWVLLITNSIYHIHGDGIDALTEAYGFNKAKLSTRSSILEYFTSNKKLNLEEIFRFITYWKD